MLPDHTALIPALRCERCGRLIPRTAVRSRHLSEREVKRAMRAARRLKRKP